MKNKYNLTLEQNIFLAKRNLVDNIYANARMEGLNITFPETKTILEGINVPNLKIDEIQCILNLRDAWKYLINNIHADFNLDFICKINELVARNESITWGILRQGGVQITGTDYIPEIPDEEDVKKQINNILQIENATERAIEYMLYGMRSQLFWDGNKRTAMIVANKLLISNGCGIISIKEDDINEFNKLLTEYYNTSNKDKIISFIYNKCIFGLELNNT